MGAGGPSTPDGSDGPEVREESASFANMDFAVTTPKFPRVLFQLQVPGLSVPKVIFLQAVEFSG